MGSTSRWLMGSLRQLYYQIASLNKGGCPAQVRLEKLTSDRVAEGLGF